MGIYDKLDLWSAFEISHVHLCSKRREASGILTSRSTAVYHWVSVCVCVSGLGLSNKSLGLEMNIVNWLVHHFKSRSHWSLRYMLMCQWWNSLTIFIVCVCVSVCVSVDIGLGSTIVTGSQTTSNNAETKYRLLKFTDKVEKKPNKLFNQWLHVYCIYYVCVLSILLDCNKSRYSYCVSYGSAPADTLSHIKGICGIVESIFLGAIALLLVPWGHQPKCTLNLINFVVILCKKKKRFMSQSGIILCNLKKRICE